MSSFSTVESSKGNNFPKISPQILIINIPVNSSADTFLFVGFEYNKYGIQIIQIILKKKEERFKIYTFFQTRLCFPF